MNTTIGILGNDFEITTQFIEKIINNTKATQDQDHIKMNIIINNYLLDKNNNEINDILEKIKKSNIDYLVLAINDKRIYQLVENSKIKIINKTFDINDNNLIKKIIKICGKETIEWKLVLLVD